MEEKQNISEEVIPTVEETVTEATKAVVESPAVEETVVEEVVVETPVIEEVIAAAPVVEEVIEEVPVIEEVIEEAPASKKVEAPALVVPAADFDWDAYENGVTLTAQSKADLEKIYDNTLNAIKDKEVVEGTVISINKREVVVNVGYKSDGIVPMSEFRYNPDLKVGDKVEVYIESQEDKKGQLLLSHKQARATRSWDRVNAALESQEIVKGFC